MGYFHRLASGVTIFQRATPQDFMSGQSTSTAVNRLKRANINDHAAVVFHQGRADSLLTLRLCASCSRMMAMAGLGSMLRILVSQPSGRRSSLVGILPDSTAAICTFWSRIPCTAAAARACVAYSALRTDCSLGVSPPPFTASGFPPLPKSEIETIVNPPAGGLPNSESHRNITPATKIA